MASRMFTGIITMLLCIGLNAKNPTDEQYLEMEKCFTENGLYIRGCDVDSIYHAMMLLAQRGKTDESNVRCTMYGIISSCYVTRIGERCGEENAKLARRRLQKRPEVIAKACESAGSIFRTKTESQPKIKEPQPAVTTAP